MLIPIVIVFFVVLVVVGVYALILTSRDTDVKEWVADSVDAWRSDGLDVDDFELKVRDTSVEDVFAKFPVASEDYLTPDDVEENWNRMVSMEREASGYVKAASAPVVEKVTEVASRVRRQEQGNSAVVTGSETVTDGTDGAPQDASPSRRDAGENDESAVAVAETDEPHVDAVPDMALEDSHDEFARIFTTDRSAESIWPGDAPKLRSEGAKDSRAA
ncbi:hypothetical protein I6E29_00585 [Arcanobacterium haemolyticum]|nr:hypothetical protein [Arcanobacterium haemolyticum]